MCNMQRNRDFRPDEFVSKIHVLNYYSIIISYINKIRHLPPKVYRCQGAQCLAAHLSTLPQLQQVWRCPNSTGWLRPDGHQVTVLRLFLPHHSAPGSGSQSLIWWDLRGPKDQAKIERWLGPLKTMYSLKTCMCILQGYCAFGSRPLY